VKAIGSVLLVGFIVVYWWLALAALLIYLVARAAPVAYRELQAERTAEQHRLRGLIARADEQHLWASAGDVRGVYGVYPV
jgi:hypothetical protein